MLQGQRRRRHHHRLQPEGEEGEEEGRRLRGGEGAVQWSSLTFDCESDCLAVAVALMRPGGRISCVQLAINVTLRHGLVTGGAGVYCPSQAPSNAGQVLELCCQRQQLGHGRRGCIHPDCSPDGTRDGGSSHSGPHLLYSSNRLTLISETVAKTHLSFDVDEGSQLIRCAWSFSEKTKLKKRQKR